MHVFSHRDVLIPFHTDKSHSSFAVLTPSSSTICLYNSLCKSRLQTGMNIARWAADEARVHRATRRVWEVLQDKSRQQENVFDCGACGCTMLRVVAPLNR